MASLWTDFLVVINQEDRALARTMPISRDRIVYMPGIGVDMSRYAASNVPDGRRRRSAGSCSSRTASSCCSWWRSSCRGNGTWTR